jgi:curved DNA-binding protein CbpA
MDQKNYYSVLQVPTSATQEQVQAAYKRLALLHHPDRSRDPKATQIMQLLNEAYEVLCRAESRAQYDLEQAAATSPGAAEKATSAEEQPSTGKQGAAQERESPQPRPKTTAKEREAQAKTRRAGMRTQLKLLLGLSFLLLVVFFLALLTGQVSAVAIFLIVLTAIGVIVSLVRKIRSPIY